jgi:hypothetical protein
MDRGAFVVATAASLVAAPAMAGIPRLSRYKVLLGDGTVSAMNVGNRDSSVSRIL